MRDRTLARIKEKTGGRLGRGLAPGEDLVTAVGTLHTELSGSEGVASAVVLLDWLDVLFEQDRFNPREVRPPRLNLEKPLPLTSWVQTSLCTPINYATVHRAMLRALVRWGHRPGPPCLEQLFEEHLGACRPVPEPAGWSWCPAGPRDVGSLGACLRFRERVRKTEVGEASLWLPVEERTAGTGGLIEVVVTAFRRADGDPNLMLAPWSFFDVVDGWVSNGRDLGADLLPALETIPWDRHDLPPSEVSFLVAFGPLRPDPVNGLEDCWETWALTPGSFELKGTSLGLAVLIGARAGLRRQGLRNVIATGAVDRIGNVADVSVELKADALKRCLGRLPPGVIFAEERKDEPRLRQCLGPLVQGNAWRLVGVSHVSDADIWELATDGFDDYLRDYRPTDPFSPSAAVTTLPTRAEYAPPFPGPERADASSEPLECVAKWARQSGDPSQAPGPFPSDALAAVAVPWGTERGTPENLAEHLESRLWRLAQPDGKTRANDRVVIVRASLAQLMKESLSDDTLPARLAEVVSARTGRRGCSRRQMENALRTEGKLLLVLHDEPSEEVWKSDWPSNPSSVRYQALSLFAQLSLDPPGRWARQAVLFVCSDLHHEAVLREAGASVLNPGRAGRGTPLRERGAHR